MTAARSTTVVLEVDVTDIVRQLARAAQAAAQLDAAIESLKEAMRVGALAEHAERIRDTFTTPAGLEGRYYVRGGLDPAYAHPAARDAYVRRLARRGRYGPLSAAAFLRGWVEHRDVAA